MKKNDDYPISIMKKTGLTLSDFRNSLILLDEKKIVAGGRKYTIHYKNLYGDIRLYLIPEEDPDPSHGSYISGIEIEKYADCFPYANPDTVQELMNIYYRAPRLGTMKTVNLMPHSDAGYLLLMYGLINILSDIIESQDSPHA